ncbi:MAG: hypothetical protein C5B46_05545 [Proteobacteria bacterium]|nr:MAG: hypothetical protein C5B46_05545 [Pseudomonadota bacterium]
MTKLTFDATARLRRRTLNARFAGAVAAAVCIKAVRKIEFAHRRGSKLRASDTRLHQTSHTLLKLHWRVASREHFVRRATTAIMSS